MVSITTEAPLTADQFMATHGGETFVDLVDGRVEFQPMPHRKHGYVSAKVAIALGRFVDDRDIGRVMINDTHIRIRSDPDTLRGADVLFVSYERLARGPFEDGVLDPAPELVFEVRSPSNTWAELVEKAIAYLKADVSVVVLLDIDTESASVYRRNEIQQTFHDGDEFVIPDVLPGFAVPVRKFFE